MQLNKKNKGGVGDVYAWMHAKRACLTIGLNCLTTIAMIFKFT